MYDKCVTMYGSVCFCVKEICKPMKVYWKYVCTPIRQREKKKRNNNLNTDGEDDRALWRKKKISKISSHSTSKFHRTNFSPLSFDQQFFQSLSPKQFRSKECSFQKKKKRRKMHKNKKYIRTMNYEKLYVYPYRRPPANKTTLQQSSILFCRRSEPTTVLRVNGSNPLLPGCLISALFHWLNKERPAVIMRIREETRAGL